MKKLPLATPCIVTWVDICGSGGWTDVGQAPEPVEIQQICYYVGRKKDHILIAQGFQGKDYSVMMAPTAIPIGCVKSIKKVR